MKGKVWEQPGTEKSGMARRGKYPRSADNILTQRKMYNALKNMNPMLKSLND